MPYRKLRVIPNAIEPVFSSPPGPAPLEPPYLLCVGTPEPRKNLPALLEAFTLVRRAGRRVRLALVGADGWGDVRVGSTEGVVAFGRVDDSELRDLYAHAEALVLPSLWEGFGLPVGEALATGCRVACSDMPALRELAGEDATYFDPATPEAISEGILRVAHAATADAAPGDELGRRRSVGRRALARAPAVSAGPLVLLDADTVGRGRTGDESYTVNLLRELPGGRAGALARLLAARPAETCRRTSPPSVRRLTARRREPVPAHPVRVPGARPPRGRGARPRALLRLAAPALPRRRDRARRLLRPGARSCSRRRDRTLLRFVRGSVRRAARVIAVSEFTRADLCQVYGVDPAKVVAIPNGVGSGFRPRDDAKEHVRQRFGIDRPYMLCVGALQPRKNVPLAIEAYAQARSAAARTASSSSPAATAGAASKCSTRSCARA